MPFLYNLKNQYFVQKYVSVKQKLDTPLSGCYLIQIYILFYALRRLL